MSAIHVICKQCGQTYFAGMVGTTMWPPHVCPEISTLQGEMKKLDEAWKDFWYEWLNAIGFLWLMRKMGMTFRPWVAEREKRRRNAP